MGDPWPSVGDRTHRIAMVFFKLLIIVLRAMVSGLFVSAPSRVLEGKIIADLYRKAFCALRLAQNARDAQSRHDADPAGLRSDDGFKRTAD